MATITSTQNVTSSTPYTLAVGNTISLTAFPINYRVGEAIYTDFSSSTPTNPTGGATIVIDGTIIDNSVHPGVRADNNVDEYAVQSRANQQATIENAGVILSPNLIAVGINDGLVYNSLNSTISGYGGIRIGVGSFGSTIINQGEVFGSKYAGINFLTPGGPLAEITNASSGLIRGGTVGTAIDETGIFVQGGFVTITNAGSIDKGGAAGYSVDIAGTQGHNQLILDPGQVLNGVAKATGVDNYITLAGTTLGTLSNPGNYIGWTLVSVAKGADWQIGTAGESVAVSGIHTFDVAGTLDVLGSITATDFNMSGTGAVVDFTAPLSTAGGNIFNGNTLGTITNFGAGDSFIVGPTVLVTQPGDSIVTDYNPTTGVYQIIDASRINDPNDYVNITVSGTNSPNALTIDNFSLSTGPGGFTVSEVPCFGAGTELLTPDGMVAVEKLAPGDTVLSARDGDAREIVWVGQRSIDLTRHADPKKVMPVRIIAGAFEPGLPERDLILSPDHALFLDGVLVEAKTLVNGTTIVWDTSRRAVTYHHIELDRHDVVLAEGLPAETYLDSGNRNMFEGAEAEVLHPDFATDRNSAGSVAQLKLDGSEVRTIRQRLLERAISLGFAITGEIDATVQAGAKRITPSIEGNTLRFNLPAGLTAATLLCSAGIPAELGADPGDRRSLGLAVTSLALIDQNGKHAIALDGNHEGFHTAEPTHRWTTGNAKINLPAYTGTATLEITTNGQAARWATKTSQRAVA
jgi:hypothetical protein